MSRLFIADVPKSRSTALARCFGNIPKSSWMLEPFMLPWHKLRLDSLSLDPTCLNLSTAYKSYWNSVSFENVLENILREHKKQGNNLLTVKDHSYAVSSCVGSIDTLIERGFKFLVLIRNPIEVVESDLRAAASSSEDAKEMLFQYYKASKINLDSTCFKPQLDLLKKLLNLKEKTSDSDFVQVLDTETLSHHPDKSVKAICDWIGVPYNPSYLQWKPMSKISQIFSSEGKDADSVAYETYEFPDNCIVDEFTRELNAVHCFFIEALKSKEFKKISSNKASPTCSSVEIGTSYLETETELTRATERYLRILKLAKEKEILMYFD